MQIAYQEGDWKASAEVPENALDRREASAASLGRGREALDAVDFQGHQVASRSPNPGMVRNNSTRRSPVRCHAAIARTHLARHRLEPGTILAQEFLSTRRQLDLGENNRARVCRRCRLQPGLAHVSDRAVCGCDLNHDSHPHQEDR
jgi:hypothetical protein